MKATCTNTPTTGDLFDFQQVELSTDQKEQEDRLANTGSDLAQPTPPPKNQIIEPRHLLRTSDICLTKQWQNALVFHAPLCGAGQKVRLTFRHH